MEAYLHLLTAADISAAHTVHGQQIASILTDG
jgi:hypothetical protein